jgi:hypothetical protein
MCSGISGALTARRSQILEAMLCNEETWNADPAPQQATALH